MLLKINKRASKQTEAKQAYEKWEAAFMASHGHEPSKEEMCAYITYVTTM